MNTGTATKRLAAAGGDGGGRRRWAVARMAALAAALAAVALQAAACGGGSPGAAGSGTAGQGRLAQALAFAHCMRSHGAPDYPDPDSSGVFLVNPSNSSSFDAPQPTRAACAHLLPRQGKPVSPAQQAQQYRRALALTRCMRKHGYPRFPDDWSQRSGNVGLLISAGIDPNSPRLSAMLTKCGF